MKKYNDKTGATCMGWLTVLLMAVSFGCKADARKEPATPNVLIFLTDDLGYGDISCYSSEAPETSRINRIAAEGVRCTDFYVPTPYCAPSRATLLTGRIPSRHGVH